MCNFLEYKDTKIVYRRYASLFFIAGCSSDDNELITLEIIHRYVEQMDKYYGNVCELDIIFSFTKAYYILDELLLAGELQESSKKNVLRCIGQQDSLEDMEGGTSIADGARTHRHGSLALTKRFDRRTTSSHESLKSLDSSERTKPQATEHLFDGKRGTQRITALGGQSFGEAAPVGFVSLHRSLRMEHHPLSYQETSQTWRPFFRSEALAPIGERSRHHSPRVTAAALPRRRSTDMAVRSEFSHLRNAKNADGLQTDRRDETNGSGDETIAVCYASEPQAMARRDGAGSWQRTESPFAHGGRANPAHTGGSWGRKPDEVLGLPTLVAPRYQSSAGLRSHPESSHSPSDSPPQTRRPISESTHHETRHALVACQGPRTNLGIALASSNALQDPDFARCALSRRLRVPAVSADNAARSPKADLPTRRDFADTLPSLSSSGFPAHSRVATSKMKVCQAQSPASVIGATYLPVHDFEAVTSALNFNTPDCNVTGGCDLYTTKSTGSDKKLYKNIDKDLSSQHAALLKLGASLSPPDREHMLATSPGMQMFSTSSAFGPLSELSSRRTFAYLIATLNASHPHYDFSHVLRPGDFKRERNLRRVMINLDSILQNVRPGFEAGSSYDSSLGSDLTSVWGPQCWSLIDKEMRLNECTIFSYHPDPDPFEEDESAIWAVHYFFFNRALKRVAYLYVRVVPVISSTSPTLRPMKLGHHKRTTDVDSDGATKRAKYWLGDRDVELVPPFEDDEEQHDDGLFWNRGEDGDLVAFSDDDYLEDMDEDDEDFDDDDVHMLDKGHDRLMSEDIAGQMEI
ncbi:hypothetical protein PCL_06462 [Purpureocillium lilacinum]|uniref:AP complex mu/sigma subunit domain-containing protein n=1 Tax=Purpureocillium lilacinum TaxID=33203 RepID=A0A2U3EMR9_PURLI|nr:hypothetical protein PCL_06462 [Purpureocillium lilacinum]